MVGKLIACVAIAWIGMAGMARSQSVLIVDPINPGYFPTAQAAVDAAASGDVILIHFQYNLPYFEVAGKSLVIAADKGQPFFGDGKLLNHSMDTGSTHTRIHDLLPGQRVVLLDVDFEGLQLDNVQGQVWLEKVNAFHIAPAMRATAVNDLVIHDGHLSGPDQVLFFAGVQVGGSGLETYSTRAVLHAVEVHGGKGSSWECAGTTGCLSGPGSLAMLASSGQLWLSAASITGGNGGLGVKDGAGVCHPGEDGGDGLLVGGGAILRLTDVPIAAGLGAAGPDPASCSLGVGGSGEDGVALTVVDGVVQNLNYDTLALDVQAIAAEQQPLTATISGPPNTGVVLLISTKSNRLSIGAVDGPLLTGVPDVVVFLGHLPASGLLSLQGQVPDLGLGVKAATITLQVLSQQGGKYVAGPGAIVLLLDSSI